MSPKDSLTFRKYQTNTILAEKFAQPFEKVVTTIMMLKQAELINSTDFFPALV